MKTVSPSKTKRMWGAFTRDDPRPYAIFDTRKKVREACPFQIARPVTVTWSTPSKRKQRKSKTGK